MRIRVIVPIVLVVIVIMPIQISPVVASSVGTKVPPRQKVQVYEIDSFTYRIAITADNGIDLFLIRGTYQVYYHYQHHQPTVSEHHYFVLIGFYFGRTVLGRPLISNVSASQIAFYPQWQDATGVMHDLVGDHPLIMINDSISDQQIIGATMLMVRFPVSRYLPQFGGQWEIIGLNLTLTDGTRVEIPHIQISLTKHNNNRLPVVTSFNSTSPITYSADNTRLAITLAVPASAIVIIDSIMLYSGTFLLASLFVLAIIRVRSRVRSGIISRMQDSD